VEDVITTGGSTRECIAVINERGGEVTAAASIVDRSGGKADVGVELSSLISLDVPTFSPPECPMCERGDTVTKPGSRDVA
jgi:orotate phosphoribosyltransferase